MNFEHDASISQRTRYARRVDEATMDSPFAAHLFKAFVTGGVLCVIAQVINSLLMQEAGLTQEAAGSVTTIAMIALGVILTGIGVYDKIYTFGGAGAAVPVTGFANSVASPAMEFKKEGWITGMGAKIFSLAGPVLVYGVSASTVVGILYYLLEVRP